MNPYLPSCQLLETVPRHLVQTLLTWCTHEALHHLSLPVPCYSSPPVPLSSCAATLPSHTVTPSMVPVLAYHWFSPASKSGQFLPQVLPKSVCPAFCGETTHPASRLKFPFLKKTFLVSPLHLHSLLCTRIELCVLLQIPKVHGWREDGENKEIHN